ncbi:MAG: DUF1853 family protein [Myxococcota bacterium]
MNAAVEWCLTGPDVLADLDDIPRFPPIERPLPPAGGPLSGPLGRRFEQRWRAYFDHHPDWTVLAADQPIRDGGRTLGAPDLIVARGAAVWHLELAVKFYLCRPDRSGAALADWVGPSVRDRLDKKVTRTRTHQLPLLDQPAAKTWLQARGLPTPTHRGAVMKGVLFAHADSLRHPEMAAAQPAGQWCTLEMLSSMVPEASVLTRDQWLGAPPPKPQSGAALHAAVAAALAAHPSHAVQLSASGRRWFVVGPRWLADVAEMD